MFDSVDLDNDGRADFHEFYTASANLDKILTEDNLNQIFKILDYDKSDRLDLENLMRVLPTNLNKEGKVIAKATLEQLLKKT